MQMSSKVRLLAFTLWEVGVLIPAFSISYLLKKQNIAINIWMNDRLLFFLLSGFLIVIFSYVFPICIVNIKGEFFQRRLLVLLCWLLALLMPGAFLQWGLLLKKLYPQDYFLQKLQEELAKLGLFNGLIIFLCWLSIVWISLKYIVHKWGEKGDR